MTAPWRNEKVRQLYRRPEVKASLEIILSVFAIAFLLLVAVRPTLATIATLQKKIEDQDVVDRKLTQKINQLNRAQGDLNTYSAQLPLFESAVTNEHDQPGVVKRVSLLAQENGLGVKFITWGAIPVVGQEIDLGKKETKAKPNTKTSVAGSAFFEINFDFRGSQEQVLSFLEDLENMDRLVRLESVDMKREEEKDLDTGEIFRGLRVTGKAITYYLPPKQ